ncbi:GNAT family N-acetyltransferase [Aliivibrio fischeri]|uniref:GNAT family N-acetyltransferase n=1 Tax=Aliivibrio fischeri TaxID=668 RepID=UPI0012D9C41A|nr:GNAT family N-acetyltransferase [Aliivibrio fischeri]MUI54548.1 GNAT family N-acetyltransferase [Aliivibrio fischeri]
MLKIKKIIDINDLTLLKEHYFSHSVGPLDGMWHFGFVPMSDHFGFYEENKLIGYCCINSDGFLLQFYLSKDAQTNISELFKQLINNEISTINMIKGAFVSTAEPEYLSLCLDNANTVNAHSIMFRHEDSIKTKSIAQIQMDLAKTEELAELVEFASQTIGAPKEWLNVYYKNLMTRQELWVYRKNDHVIATGECRRFDEYQKNYADLGMIVSQNHRGKGIATQVLNFLVQQANRHNLQAICSTESMNIGAQKAISNAGFTSKNRIVQFDFN